MSDAATTTPTTGGSSAHKQQHSIGDGSSAGSFSSSTSNLRYIEKNEKKLNSNCDLKALHQQFETPALLAKLNSNPAINNSDSLAQMLHKNIITVGSEPNLVMNDALANHRKQNRTASSASATSATTTPATTTADMMMKHSASKHSTMDKMDRRFSVSTVAAASSGLTTTTPGSNDIFTFPSLTDLSFNFTSLAAQKILQGVSLNSIDTLVELNMAQQEKQQNIVSPASGDMTSAAAAVPTTTPQAICTDYGLV